MQTTRECVYLVRRVQFRSRDRDGGHTIRSVVAETPMLYANFTALSSTEPELLLIEVLHCGYKDFRSFLLLWPLYWLDDLRNSLIIQW